MQESSLRESLNDSQWKGEGVKANIAIKNKGPLTNRRCTDMLFAIFFLAFCGVMIWIGIFAKENGNPQELITPVDEDGKLCGMDYPDYPYVYYLIEPKVPQSLQANQTTGRMLYSFSSIRNFTF